MNEAREALFWSADENNAVRCGLCPHRCYISENASGICSVRENRKGVLYASGYGRVSSVALDPIEKKPLYMFHPGKRILSIGGFGCNFHCPFCQNYEISMEYGDLPRNPGALPPDEVAALAVQAIPDGNIGVAYTYNEPLIGYEYVYDCAGLVRAKGLRNVLVTNGYINREPLDALLPLIDAMNIDLKGFTDDFYKKIGGRLDAVKETIALAAGRCHVEVTTLVIPGNVCPGAEHSSIRLRGRRAEDAGGVASGEGNEGDIEGIAMWLSSIDPGIPLHLSRFFPRYRYSDRTPTPRETILKLCDTAGKHLKNVFAGNMG